MRAPRQRPHLPAVVVLTLVWVLLWDHISLFIVLTGIGLAVLVGLVFPLPPIELHGRIRPLALLRLATRLLTDVVRSSVAVVALAFRFGSTPHSAIIRVQLRSRSDLYLTQTAELVSLVPGSIVLEAHRSNSMLYLHVLDAVEEADLERARQAVLDAEARVLRAFGSAEEIEALENGWPQPGVSTLPSGVSAPELGEGSRHD
ncbi:MAG: Na+/H+ antiporter subunit E [Propionibacteriaceae bacterium]